MPFAAQRRHQYWSVDIRYIEDHALGTGKPVYVISILENFSRALLASAISPRQDLTAYLIVLRAAIETHGAPEVLVSDSGSVFKANQARAIYAALGIAHRQIDAGPSLAELHRDPLQRHAPHGRLPLRPGHDLGGTAGRPRALLPRLQPASRTSPTGADRRAPQPGRRARAGCTAPGATRPTSTGSSGCGPPACSPRSGSVRFRHWRLYGERGLAGERAAVWVRDETLTIEYATETLAQYRVQYEADGRRLQEVTEPRLFATDHASPQPFLAPLETVEWHPAQRLAPYRPRRTRRGEGWQAPLLPLEPGAAAG